MISDIFISIILVLILFIAILSIIRGYKNFNTGKNFDTENKKIKITYQTVSIIHMIAGIIIVLFYIAVLIFVLLGFLGEVVS